MIKGENIGRKFRRRMEFFFSKGGSCSYDDESIGDIEVPFRYKHLVKQWVPKELPPLDTNLFFNNKIYHIALSSLHGMGLFSMDGIKVKYGVVTRLTRYVKPHNNYSDCMGLV